MGGATAVKLMKRFLFHFADQICTLLIKNGVFIIQQLEDFQNATSKKRFILTNVAKDKKQERNRLQGNLQLAIRK